MKIALVTNGIWPYVIGGMEKHSYYLCKFLAQKGVYIDLYHTAKNTKYDINKLEFFTEEEKKFITPIVIPFPSSDGLPGHYLRASKKYSEHLYQAYQQRERPDFIYTKGMTAWYFLKQKLKGENLPPISVKVHGYEMFQMAPSWKAKLGHYLLRPIFRFVNQKADYVFSYGGKITNIIINQLHVDSKKVVEIPTGIDASWVYEENNKLSDVRKVVFLGRYERRKGVEELSAALNVLKNTHQFQFHFIGQIPDEKKIIDSKIIYHGVITNAPEIQQILRNSDILVCPSYSEGMPNVIMEAMASGCAIIATDVGAVAEMVDNTNGWLLPKPDVQLLTKAISEALTCDAQRLIACKQKSISKVKEQFLWQNVIDKLISHVNSIK